MSSFGMRQQPEGQNHEIKSQFFREISHPPISPFSFITRIPSSAGLLKTHYIRNRNWNLSSEAL